MEAEVQRAKGEFVELTETPPPPEPVFVRSATP